MDNYEDAWTVFYRVISEIKNAEKEINGGTACFYTGFRDLDATMGGFRPGELVVIAGRPCMGKTAFALNILRNQVIRNNKKIAYISLEERSETILQKLLIMDGFIDSSCLRTGILSDDQWKTLLDSAERFGKSRLLISDAPKDICGELRSLKKEHDIDGLIIDYFQLVGSSNMNISDDKDRTGILREIKKAAVEAAVPVIILSQLPRTVEERENRRPLLSDLPEMGVHTDIADTVMFLYRDDYYHEMHASGNTASPYIAEINVSKHIAGKTGITELYWNPEFITFHDKEPDCVEYDFTDEIPFN